MSRTRADNAMRTGAAVEPTLADAIGAAWNRFWFTPAAARPLAIVRIAAGCLALALWLSYGADLDAWFGPTGIVSRELLGRWRSPWAISLFDFATTSGALQALYVAGAVVIVMLIVGLIVGQLTAGLKAQASAARSSEERVLNLYGISRDLGRALTIGQVAEIVDAFVVRQFGHGVVMWVRDRSGCLQAGGSA